MDDTITADASRSFEQEAEAATEAACKMLETGLLARQPRFDVIRKNEDMYNGVNSPALKGRSNIPFDAIVMGGFIDTMMGNINEPIDLQFDRTREQDKLSADKVTAVWQRESSPNHAAWNDKIQDARFLAAFSGRGFNKLFMANVPKFKSDLETVDHYDMVTEPQGGAYLDNHLFKFQMNIFRSKGELKSGVNDGFYNKTQVRKLILLTQNPDTYKKVLDQYNNKLNRYAAFGIDINANNYIGQTLYGLVEGAINFNSKWYHILFSYETKTWVRFEPLEKVYPWAEDYPGRGGWTSWATNRHPFLFWTKAPADDIRPIAYSMKKIVNLTIDNLEKRNWDMKAYDPRMFNDPTQLLWRQDGLVRATVKPGMNIQNGIYEFKTPDTTGITINLTEWLNNFVGQKTGITPDAQGASQADTNGINFSNIQATSKRMMLQNKMFHKAASDLGIMFDYGLYHYLREPYAVKILGNDGIRWEEDVTRHDTEKSFSVTVISKSEEDEKNNIVLSKKREMFKDIEANPLLLKELNISMYLKEKLKFGGYNDEQSRLLLDKTNDADDILMAQCAQAIQEIIENQTFVPVNRNANTAYVNKILNFAQQSFPLYPQTAVAQMSPSEQKKYQKDMLMFDRLVQFAEAHLPIAQKNMERKLVQQMAARGPMVGPDGQPTQPAQPTAPASAPAM